MNRKLAAILAIALVAPAAASAQLAEPPRIRTEEDNTRFGGTSAVFLTLPGDARGAALDGRSRLVAARRRMGTWCQHLQLRLYRSAGVHRDRPGRQRRDV